MTSAAVPLKAAGDEARSNSRSQSRMLRSSGLRWKAAALATPTGLRLMPPFTASMPSERDWNQQREQQGQGDYQQNVPADLVMCSCQSSSVRLQVAINMLTKASTHEDACANHH